MGSEHDWEPNRKKLDLWLEREKVKWWWRLAAMVASSLIVAGFIVFPVSFNNDDNFEDYYRASRLTFIVLAICLVSVGYMISILLCFVCHSWLFLHDAIFLPCMTASAIGIFSICYNVAIRKDSSADTLFYSAVFTGALSYFMYGAAAAFVYRKIIKVRKTEDAAREAPPDPTQWNDGTSLISAHEAQRQQLLGLLFNRNNDQPPSREMTANTYRIDLPLPNDGRETEERLLPSAAGEDDPRSRSRPTNSYEMRTVTAYSPEWDRPPSPFVPSTTAGSRGGSPSGRERRRAEIELWGSNSKTTVRSDSAGPSPGPRLQRVQPQRAQIESVQAEEELLAHPVSSDYSP